MRRHAELRRADFLDAGWGWVLRFWMHEFCAACELGDGGGMVRVVVRVDELRVETIVSDVGLCLFDVVENVL